MVSKIVLGSLVPAIFAEYREIELSLSRRFFDLLATSVSIAVRFCWVSASSFSHERINCWPAICSCSSFELLACCERETICRDNNRRDAMAKDPKATATWGSPRKKERIAPAPSAEVEMKYVQTLLGLDSNILGFPRTEASLVFSTILALRLSFDSSN